MIAMKIDSPSGAFIAAIALLAGLAFALLVGVVIVSWVLQRRLDEADMREWEREQRDFRQRRDDDDELR